jgi:hypothetical protein
MITDKMDEGGLIDFWLNARIEQDYGDAPEEEYYEEDEEGGMDEEDPEGKGDPEGGEVEEEY